MLSSAVITLSSSNMKATLFYPMYPFTMYSLRGTWSVGFAGWFSLWVMFYVFDEWFMGKLRGSLDFLHTMIKHYKQIFGTKRTSEYFKLMVRGV